MIEAIKNNITYIFISTYLSLYLHENLWKGDTFSYWVVADSGDKYSTWMVIKVDNRYYKLTCDLDVEDGPYFYSWSDTSVVEVEPIETMTLITTWEEVSKDA